jgi:hypothetical protein
MSDQLRINGNQYSWGSIVLKLDNDVFTGFTGLTYADKRERVKAYGMGRHHAPRGRSRGKYSTDPVKLTGWRGSVQIFRRQLALRAIDQRSYGDVEFQIVSQYIEIGEIPLTVEIDRCVIIGNSTTDEENPDPLKEELEIDCMLIRRNQLVLFDGSQGQP